MERWLAAELSMGDYTSPRMTAQQLSLMLNGLLLMQLVHRQPTYAEAVLAMLPTILASGRAV